MAYASWGLATRRQAEGHATISKSRLWSDPGKESGNALALEPLPDLTAVSDDVDELEEAVAMVGGLRKS